MPDQEPTQNKETASGDLELIEGSSSLLAKIKVLAFLLLVIGGECMLFFFFMPSQSDLVNAAGRSVGAPAAEDADDNQMSDELADVPNDVIEADLGKFSITSYIHLTNTHLRIDFKLVGIVKMDHEAEFGTRLEANQHRIREKVIVTVRSMKMADLLEDPALGLLKRKISISLNRILGKELLQDVIFSDYSVLEQS